MPCITQLSWVVVVFGLGGGWRGVSTLDAPVVLACFFFICALLDPVVLACFLCDPVVMVGHCVAALCDPFVLVGICVNAL